MLSLPRPAVTAIAGGVVVAALAWAVIGLRHESAAKAVAIANAKAAQAEARDARAQAERANAYAGKLLPLVTQLTDSAEKWKRRAALTTARSDSLARAFATIAQDAPDTCAPVIQAARETIAAQGLTVAALRSSLGFAEAGRDSLVRLVTDSLRPAIARLIRADAKLDTAATHLARVVSPPWYRFAWLRPKLGAGVAAVYDPLTRRVYAGPALTLGWTF